MPGMRRGARIDGARGDIDLNEHFFWKRNVPTDLELKAEDWTLLHQQFARNRKRLLWPGLALTIPILVVYFTWEFWLDELIIGHSLYGWLGILEMIVFVVICQLVLTYFLRAQHARMVRRILRELGHEVCPQCGYWLRGLRDDATKCPECGAARGLRTLTRIRPEDERPSSQVAPH